MPQSIDTLLTIMARLRDPVRGCSWDVAQTFASIVPYTIEEAYEVADAVDRGELQELRDELGDLLLQVVFHARIAEEAGAFRFEDVAAAIVAKLIRRHPHVFDATGAFLPEDGRRADPEDVAAAWEDAKARERERRTSAAAPLLDGVALALPALSRAGKISSRAAAYGFDWPDAASVVAKVHEEADEVAEALANGSTAAVAEEIGDLLFAVANLARHAGVDPETALRAGNAKFERRFEAMGRRLQGQGRPLRAFDLAAMEEAWAAVKREEVKG